jgi:monoterpene epsilon-lactone hydrolase
MESMQSIVFNTLLRLTHKKGLLKRQFVKGNFNRFASPSPPARLYQSYHVDKYQVNGRNVFTISPRDGNICKKHILYFHGGAFVTNFLAPHWRFFKKLITNSGCRITAPDYPLAPANTYKEVFAMTVDLYRKILLNNDADDLVLMGDSAGGGLALALAQRLRIDDLPQPKQIILLSPWLDITLSNPEIERLDPIDPFMGIEGLRMAGKAYAGNADPGHYLLSPINGRLEGLGKISIFVGTREILVADARKLKTLLALKSIDINYREYKGMIHAWMLLHFPESKKAKDEIADLINSEA